MGQFSCSHALGPAHDTRTSRASSTVLPSQSGSGGPALASATVGEVQAQLSHFPLSLRQAVPPATGGKDRGVFPSPMAPNGRQGRGSAALLSPSGPTHLHPCQWGQLQCAAQVRYRVCIPETHTFLKHSLLCLTSLKARLKSLNLAQCSPLFCLDCLTLVCQETHKYTSGQF